MEVTEVQYKETEICKIPLDWDVRRLSECCKKITDGTHDTPKPVYTGVPFLTAIHVKQNYIDYKNCYFLPKEVHEVIYKRCNPEYGDVLMVNIGAGVATTALINVDFEFSLKNVALLKPNRNIISGAYLHHYQSYVKQVIADTITSGGAQPFLSLKQIGDLQIALPTKSEQTAIATALSDVDTLIENLEKLIAKKRNIKQGTIQVLLNPKKNWKLKTYGEVFTFLRTATYSRAELSEGDEIGYIHYGDIHTKLNYFLDTDTIQLPTLPIEKSKNYSLVRDGDIIMADASEDYAGIGKSVEVRNIKNRKLISGLHTFLLRDERKIFIDGFRGYLHKSSFIKKQFDTLATGMKVYGVTKNNLKTVEIPIPPIEEQHNIAATLINMEKEILSFEQKLIKYRMTKQGMMQTLLTGKIRLI